MKKITVVYVPELTVKARPARSPGEHHTTIERELGSSIVKLRTSNGHTVHLNADSLKKAVAAI